MAEAAPAEESRPTKKGGKLPLLVGILLMLALGGGGFYAARSGLILAAGGGKPEEKALDPLPEVAFVAVEPMILSLGPRAGGRYLRFSAQIEVAKGYEEEVRQLLPRVLDVMNSYLRAVDLREFEEPSALIRLRAQITRRVQLVAGGDRVRDVLVTEFVIN